MPQIESVLSSVMQQQSANNEMTSKLAAELEKMQELFRQLEAKSQAQDLREKESSASHGNPVTSEDIEDSEEEEDNAAVRSWLKAKEEDRERQQNEAKLIGQGASTAPIARRDQGIQTDLPQSHPTESPTPEPHACGNDPCREKELQTWKSAARQYEVRTGYYKLRAETAEKMLKDLGK